MHYLTSIIRGLNNNLTSKFMLSFKIEFLSYLAHFTTQCLYVTKYEKQSFNVFI